MIRKDAKVNIEVEYGENEGRDNTQNKIKKKKVKDEEDRNGDENRALFFQK